jgi:hypothetical protein
MNRRPLTLIEVLQPQCFKSTPERSRVTRTIVQPEIDAFEQQEAQGGSPEKSALAARCHKPVPRPMLPQLAGA